MSETTKRNYAGISKPERIARRRIALIEAAMQLSDEVGWRNVTVEGLCLKAKLNKRYFYENFTDLDSVSCAVVDHVTDEVLAKMATTVVYVGQPVAELAKVTIDTFVRFMTEIPCRAKLIFGDLIMSDRITEHRKKLVKGIVSEIMRHAREIHHAQHEQDPIIETTAIFLLGGTGQAILYWLDAKDKPSIEKLISDLTALWLITGNGIVAYARGQ